MSSKIGGSLEGGRNEDVEADEAVRTSEARIADEMETDIMNHENFVETDDAEEELADLEEIDDVIAGEGIQRTTDKKIDQDVAKLNGEDDELILNDVGSESGAATPIPEYSLASPVDTGSIADDTPSVQSSVASPLRNGGSPVARKTVLRTPSGALQPFEHRFESRLAASPSGSPRVQSPAFLNPQSRQISLSSQISGVSSQDTDAGVKSSETPWDVIRWTKLRKITSQAFSEIGKRNFGRPTCMAVSALIAIGTSKGLILGFDYHQTLKIIIGQGTKATECGSVTALAIAADYSTIASGHANGHIFTWEINRPARPFLQIPPIDPKELNQSRHPDGHLSGCAVLHIGLLGTRHTALVSADAGGMAFSHITSRGLGPVTRTINTTRLLGRYPQVDKPTDPIRKPSSVLAFSPLPLGNVEQATDSMGLTALLTPYLLVVVSTTPIAQTQHKSPRSKDISPHSTLSGCLAWFPAVKLKNTNSNTHKGNSDTKLVYCWSNVLTVLDVKVVGESKSLGPHDTPALEFLPRSRWHADEAIVAVQWLGRSVLGVLTISQRLLILEDSTLHVTDSIDLLYRHIYHQDPFSHQLKAVVEQLNPEDLALHGVVADAFYMSFRVYKGRTFLLGFNDLSVGILSNWADRLMALMEAGDHIAAIGLATEYYSGGASNVTIGLAEEDSTRHELVKERLLAMISASLNYTFSQHDANRTIRLRELAEVCFEACTTIQETDYLLNEVFDWFQEAEEDAAFITVLTPYVLEETIPIVPPEVVKSLVAHYIAENQIPQLEELLCRLDPHSFDLDQISTLCQQHNLYDALIYIWTQAIGDYVTPLVNLLSRVKMLKGCGDDEALAGNPFCESATKIFPYLAFSLTGRRYPRGENMAEQEALQAKKDLYDFVFAGTPVAWPRGSGKVFQTADNPDDEPAFPYLCLMLHFNAASVISMLNEAFEDSFLNEPDDEIDQSRNNAVDWHTDKPGRRKSRQQIIEIMFDIMRHGDFVPEQMIYLDMFVARSLPKYPGQLILSGSLLNGVLRRLCWPPVDALKDDCQLSVEYLLSAHRVPNIPMLIEALRNASFFRVLKSVYRGENMFTELLETYFEDPECKHDVFECITSCLRLSTDMTQKQVQTFKQVVSEHIQDLVDIDINLTSRTLASAVPELLAHAVNEILDSHQRFIFLRTLLEPTLLRDPRYSSSPLPWDQLAEFTEHYVQLMCRHDPTHVADYVKDLPSSNLRLEAVLPMMESMGVIDAAIALLARDGLVRDAIDRLVAHIRSLEHALVGLIETVASSFDATASQQTIDDLADDLEKYMKVGTWLCSRQSRIADKKPRPRTNLVWEISEDDLDLDEYLWLDLVDVVVEVTQNVSAAIVHVDSHPAEQAYEAFDRIRLASSLRHNVQQIFTVLMTTTTAPEGRGRLEEGIEQAKQRSDRMSFLRVLRAFLTRAAKSAPTLADLRAVLADIFSAYAFEQEVLSLANELVGFDVFADIQKANGLRQRGWQPRSQVCERCKRRAWGIGIGEVVWDEWIVREQERDTNKTRKMLERSGGEQARRLSRGKARASTSSDSGKTEDSSEETKKLALVVFACRHTFHRVCLDEGFAAGKQADAGGQMLYRCPVEALPYDPAIQTCKGSKTGPKDGQRCSNCAALSCSGNLIADFQLADPGAGELATPAFAEVGE